MIQDGGGTPGGTGGSLIKTDTGTLTLSGANTYTGGTTVEAGTLRSANCGTTGSITGDAEIATSSTLAFNRSDVFTFAGVVTGGAAIDKLGSGTLTLTGDSSGFAGTTMVSGGALIVGENAEGALGGTLDVLAGGRLGGPDRCIDFAAVFKRNTAVGDGLQGQPIEGNDLLGSGTARRIGIEIFPAGARQKPVSNIS